ncbi:MAG TPA: hypothetical protein VGV62_04865 [Xanthobacteraceae bacterium]|nr:hypothetical protein [Xanthobacteraceae bacterium]
MALLPVVAAPVGCEPGITHVVWQLAAWELHDIMQFKCAAARRRHHHHSLASQDLTR